MASPTKPSALSSPLSPLNRPTSRSSSRASVRSGRASPSISFNPEDPVAIRNQMSSLKHNIRQQQAQLNKLEDTLHRGPRPLPPEFSMVSLPHSPNASVTEIPAFGPPSAYPGSTHLAKRSSYSTLQEIAGSDSSLPLPIPRASVSTSNLRQDGIREGVPMEFSTSSGSNPSKQRSPSPTRTLSRIPVSSVGNYRALSDDIQATPPSQSHHAQSDANSSMSSLHPPPSPTPTGGSTNSSSTGISGNHTSKQRISLTPGGTTRVLADLQAGVLNARAALENTKSQLRLSQRAVAALTRQTEDLKEGRERLRLENEGLNNVVARKERLLQESVARARKAEEERDTLRGQLKQETTTSKKSLRDMESSLSEATSLSQRREREYVTLRDSIKSMTDSWKADAQSLRDEMRKREERMRAEAQEVGRKYQRLVEEVKKKEEARAAVRELLKDERRITESIGDEFRGDVKGMREDTERSARAGEEALKIANALSMELGRLRRLMQAAGRGTGSDAQPPAEDGPPSAVTIPNSS